MKLDDQISFVESIDLEPLYKEIRKHLKKPDIHFTSKVKTTNNRLYILFESENLAEECGIAKEIFDEFKLETFNSQIVEDGEQLNYWLTVHFSWHCTTGGENGTSFAEATYKNGIWDVVFLTKD